MLLCDQALSLRLALGRIAGMIAANNLEQAIERAGTKMGNKGWDAAMAAVEMVSVFKQV